MPLLPRGKTDRAINEKLSQVLWVEGATSNYPCADDYAITDTFFFICGYFQRIILIRRKYTHIQGKLQDLFTARKCFYEEIKWLYIFCNVFFFKITNKRNAILFKDIYFGNHFITDSFLVKKSAPCVVFTPARAEFGLRFIYVDTDFDSYQRSRATVCDFFLWMDGPFFFSSLCFHTGRVSLHWEKQGRDGWGKGREEEE